MSTFVLLKKWNVKLFYWCFVVLKTPESEEYSSLKEMYLFCWFISISLIQENVQNT